MLFNDSFYIEKSVWNGYKLISSNSYGLQSEEIISRYFVAEKGLQSFLELISEKKSIITTGFGMSSYPHAGTISQIMKCITLSRLGFNLQIVLGDLDTYLSRNQDLDCSMSYVCLFGQFIRSLNSPKISSLLIRDQYHHLTASRTAMLVAQYLSDQDFDNVIEDVDQSYRDANIHQDWSFPMKCGLTLMIADFVDLFFEGNYENILIMLGFDEHRYAKLAIKVIERMDLDINVSAIFSRVLPGLNGHPKMSKSLKGSTIDVHTPKEEIKTTLKLQERNFARPREDSSYLFIEQVSLNEDLSVMELNEAYHDFDRKEWNKFIDTYIDTILVPILKRWPGKSNTHTNNVN